MRYELISILVIWLFFNITPQYFWIVNTNIGDEDIGDAFSLSSLNMINFFFVFSRSLFCIVISSFKHIFDSYTVDQAIVQPEDERVLDTVDSVIRNDKGIEYFAGFLEE